MSRVEDSTNMELLHVRSHWGYVRKKLRRRGMVEVDNAHPHHDMLCAMQTAIHKLLTDHPEAKAKEELQNEDFIQRIKFSITTDSGKRYHFASYASPVFACIRLAVGIDEDDFLDSLSPSGVPYLEFISNSHSGQDFYFRDYLTHFHTYPHSLLVKFLGLFSIKKPRSRKKYFLVMQSIFYPTVRLEQRFDIKGCLTNRYQDPNPPGAKTIIVLKDHNFIEETLQLGNKKDWFLTQLRADVDFLLLIGVQDYSLLLGRHAITVDEKRESMGNLVLRMKRSFGHEKVGVPLIETETSSIEENQPSDQPLDATSTSQIHAAETPSRTKHSPKIEMQVISEQHDASSPKKSPVKNNAVFPLRRNKVTFLRSLSDSAYLDSTGLMFHNRRLLLNTVNALHIIDGDNCRYYVGVIDFFTQFRCRQRVGKFFKDIKTCCGNHSTEPPNVYAERFFKFVSDRVV